MQVQRIQNNDYNPNFTSIKYVYYKGYFNPRAVETDRNSVEYFRKNKFIKKLAKIWDFDVIFSLEQSNYCTALNKTIELKGRKPNPIPKYSSYEIGRINNRSFIPMIKSIKESITKFGGDTFNDYLR